MEFDFLVIGSGLAGLTSALTLAKYGEVLLVSKRKLSDSATSLAQGGIAAVVGRQDTYKQHVEDTLVAGAWHNKKKAVWYLVKNAPAAIAWLEKCGVEFDKTDGGFCLGREAAHRYPRIVHATDFTGWAIQQALLKKILDNQNILCWGNCFALDLLVKDGCCWGAQILKGEKIINCFARATILATGGLGQVYQWTTNPEVATGDGIAMAYRAGAKLSDLEFVQFHPTALKWGQSPLFLLSEAIRGEGGVLVDAKNKRFMKRIDSQAELAPRDIVARAIFEKQKEGEVFLDIRGKGESFLKKRFPNIYRELKKRGFDMAKDLLPVTPAAHYSCGGIETDLFGRTSMANLFAFGEVAGSGVHGANRLASNSLLEAVVFPLNLPKCIDHLPQSVRERGFPILDYQKKLPFLNFKKNLQELMWHRVGILRNQQGLKLALKQVRQWQKEIEKISAVNMAFMELKNMTTVCRLIGKAALSRPKSLGCHFLRN